MSTKITDIQISCDAALDQDVNQEIGFLGEENFKIKMYQEMLMDQGAREAAGVCECCNGTGSYWDCGPHNSRRESCENCNGTGFIESGIPMVGNEEYYICRVEDAES